MNIQLFPIGVLRMYHETSPKPYPLSPVNAADLFMRNKPNLLNAQMNLTKALANDYEKKTLGKRGKNKPNSNPIQTQTNPIPPARYAIRDTRYEIRDTRYEIQTQSNPISNVTLLKWLITRR